MLKYGSSPDPNTCVCHVSMKSMTAFLSNAHKSKRGSGAVDLNSVYPQLSTFCSSRIPCGLFYVFFFNTKQTRVRMTISTK